MVSSAAKLDPSPPPFHRPCYHALPPDDEPEYILLPVYVPAVLRRRRRSRLICYAALLAAALLAIYVLWPSDPEITVSRIRLERVHIHTSPYIALDIAMNLTIKVRNRNFYSMDYRSLVVGIGYRGKKLGFITSERGHVKARATSYVEARLELDQIAILSDVILLLEDLARGSIPFETITEVRGQLGLGFLELPLQGKVTCEVYVNMHNQTIVRQNCYPE